MTTDDLDRPKLLQVQGLGVQFVLRRSSLWRSRRVLQAVEDVGFEISRGETLAIVGESGCGKSTLARALMGLVPIHRGTIEWKGETLAADRVVARRWPRKEMQMIFQDPLACLNPRMTVAKLISEPLDQHESTLSRGQMRARVLDMMAKVGLDASAINRYPHEFSGGQCQRIGIARALICKPELLICDEPVSALDVSIRAQIVNLLKSLQRDLGLAVIFIAHDLAIVRHLADRVMVMYLGRCVEIGEKRVLYAQPGHPYTRMLLEAAPIPDPRVARMRSHALEVGELPSPLAPPPGCRFHTRCTHAAEQCAYSAPDWQALSSGQSVACHLYAEGSARASCTA